MTLTIPADRHIVLTDQAGEVAASAIRADDDTLITQVNGVTLGIHTAHEDGSVSFYHPFAVEGLRTLLERVTGATVEPPLPDPEEMPSGE